MTFLHTFYNQLANHPIFTHPSLIEILLIIIEYKDVLQYQLTFRYIYLLVVRVTMSASQSSANIYYHKKNHTNSMKSKRLLLFPVQSEKYIDESSCLVYITESHTQNSNLWNKNVNHCDNGDIYIGSIIRQPLSMPAQYYMRNYIPILQSYMLDIILKTPCQLSSTSMNDDIEAKKSLGFVYNRNQLSVNFSAPIKNLCSRNICDRQRVNAWIGTKGCGCYGMSPNRTNL